MLKGQKHEAVFRQPRLFSHVVLFLQSVTLPQLFRVDRLTEGQRRSFAVLAPVYQQLGFTLKYQTIEVLAKTGLR